MYKLELGKSDLPIFRKSDTLLNQRKDFHWKLATEFCATFDTLVIETLNLDGMKHLCGRKVSALSFYPFVEILRYKCHKHKRVLKEIDQWTATPQSCSDCGYHNQTLTLSDRQWRSPKCGSHHDKDINAAINILWAGIVSTT